MKDFIELVRTGQTETAYRRLQYVLRSKITEQLKMAPDEANAFVARAYTVPMPPERSMTLEEAFKECRLAFMQIMSV